LTTH